jgi:hypothetical protein
MQYVIAPLPSARASVATIELVRYVADYTTKPTDTQQASSLLYQSIVGVAAPPPTRPVPCAAPQAGAFTTGTDDDRAAAAAPDDKAGADCARAPTDRDGAGGAAGDDGGSVPTDETAPTDAAATGTDGAPKKQGNMGAMARYFAYRDNGGELNLHDWAALCTTSCG